MNELNRKEPTLTHTFRSHGYSFRPIAFSEGWHLFEKTKGPERHYEIVKPCWREASNIKGKEIKARWAYPSPTQWGTDGFSYITLESAKHHLSVAEQYERNKEIPYWKLKPVTKKQFWAIA